MQDYNALQQRADDLENQVNVLQAMVDSMVEHDLQAMNAAISMKIKLRENLLVTCWLQTQTLEPKLLQNHSYPLNARCCTQTAEKLES